MQSESLSWSGSKFQTAGPATENARRPSVLRRWRGSVSKQASPQPKRQLDRFSCLCTDDRGVSLHFTTVCLFSPQNCPFPCWYLDLMLYVVHLTHPNRNANGNLIVSAVFAGLTSVTEWQSDRKTDRPRYSVRCGIIMRNYVGYGKAAIVWL